MIGEQRVALCLALYRYGHRSGCRSGFLFWSNLAHRSERTWQIEVTECGYSLRAAGLADTYIPL
jgi:hypothetical protein